MILVMNIAASGIAPLDVTASDAARLLDGEAARVAGKLLCSACHSDKNVRLQNHDLEGGLGFCDDCLDGARTTLVDGELGGEG